MYTIGRVKCILTVSNSSVGISSKNDNVDKSVGLINYILDKIRKRNKCLHRLSLEWITCNELQPNILVYTKNNGLMLGYIFD